MARGEPDARVGLIGIGTIGGYFVKRLLADDWDLVVYDVDAEKVADAVERGATAGESPADVARRADVIVLSLPGQQFVEAAMEGDDGVLSGLEGGEVVVDTGTTRPDADVRYQRRCREVGADYLDAPLTWGGPGEYTDERGPAFSMFVGGDEDAYERTRSVIESLSYSHRHYGPIGSGHVVKAGQRMYGALRRLIRAEVVEFLRNNGVDPEAVNDHLEWGFGEEQFVQTLPEPDGLADALAESDATERGFRLDERGLRTQLREGKKDLKYAHDIAHSSNTATPFLSTAMEVLKSNAEYRRTLDEHDADYDWGVRTGAAYWRRASRPHESWTALLDDGA